MHVALVTWSELPHLAPDDRLLRDELARRGAEVRAVAWDDPGVEWGAFDAIVLRSTWDYHTRVEEFRVWLDWLVSESAELWNPVSLVRWNLHKSYLLDLESRGVRIVPTALIPRGSVTRVSDVMHARGWSRAVVKPAVSASASRTYVVDAAFAVEHPADEDQLVQVFVDAVSTSGEWSFVFLDGAFSHAALKRPALGEFRVQPSFGGTATAVSPPPRLLDQAEEIMACIDEPWLYARVDAVEIDRRLHLMELEMIEPSLFLDLHGDAPAKLARAILDRASHRLKALSSTSTISAAPSPSGSCLGS